MVPARTPAASRDGGFTMMEVVAAMVVLAIFATISLSFILRTTSAAGMNSRRVTASNIANKQIESTRSQKPQDIPNGQITLPTQKVGGLEFRVTQTSSLVEKDSQATVCQSTSNQMRYKLVTVVVTWEDMGLLPHVKMSA